MKCSIESAKAAEELLDQLSMRIETHRPRTPIPSDLCIWF
jgi:hypothetical protein